MDAWSGVVEVMEVQIREGKIRIEVEGKHILCPIEDWEKLKDMIQSTLQGQRERHDDENGRFSWSSQSFESAEYEEFNEYVEINNENANFAWEYQDNKNSEKRQ